LADVTSGPFDDVISGSFDHVISGHVTLLRAVPLEIVQYGDGTVDPRQEVVQNDFSGAIRETQVSDIILRVDLAIS
jgi:hypothetical protein